MAVQKKGRLELSCDSLEWLYIPDVVYAEYRECKRHLQLMIPYRPAWTTDQRYPLVLFIPGSAWHRQELYNSIPSYAKLAERGCVVAVLQIRESEIAPFPAQVQDTKAALRFLVQRADRFHIDTNSLFVAGNSSGGHIALLTGLTAAHGLYDTELYPSVAANIRGIVACSAPTDILQCAKQPLPPGMSEDARPTAALLGVPDVLQNVPLARAASCEPYITKEVRLPPILLFHGAEDPVVPASHSRSLFQLLETADLPVTYYEISGAGHGGPVFWMEPVLERMMGFIQQEQQF